MSRSRRKKPFQGITTASSEKEEKREANRVERRVNREILRASGDGDQVRLTREVSDPWRMSKDGKARFDSAKYPESMRK